MVNDELFKFGGLFATGRDLLQQGHCAKVRPVVEQVVSIMTVPLVQGTLRYAYKVGNKAVNTVVGQASNVANKASDQNAKNAAEGSTFAAAVLPMVHACNAASATIVANHMKFGLVFDTTTGAYVSGTVPDFAAVKSAIEDTYACLGITCAHVGALMNGAAPYAGAEACTHASATIAGYFPGSDVTQHNALDGDQAAMQTALKIPDFTAATTAYATGGSSTSKGKFRTLKGFSTKAQGKMYDGAALKEGSTTALVCPGCPYKHYKMFYDYYSDFDYADKWVSAALGGTDMTFTSGKFGPNNFATMHTDARVEAAKKGSAYMHVWMYAIREFEDAIDDCVNCVADCNTFLSNTGPVHAWDEGVAFYTGAREGRFFGGNSAGAMVYRLAQKRCANFGTCTGAHGMSQVNDELFKVGGLFATGRDLLQQGHCHKVRPVVEQIVSIMTVPLVQGTLRYAYKVGNKAV